MANLTAPRMLGSVWVKKARALLRESPEDYEFARSEQEDTEGEPVYDLEGEAAIDAAARGEAGVYVIVRVDSNEVVSTCRLNPGGQRILGGGRIQKYDDLARRERGVVEGHERLNVLVMGIAKDATATADALRAELEKERDRRREAEAKLAAAEDEDGLGAIARMVERLFAAYQNKDASAEIFARFAIVMASLNEEQRAFAMQLHDAAIDIPDEQVKSYLESQKSKGTH